MIAQQPPDLLWRINANIYKYMYYRYIYTFVNLPKVCFMALNLIHLPHKRPQNKELSAGQTHKEALWKSTSMRCTCLTKTSTSTYLCAPQVSISEKSSKQSHNIARRLPSIYLHAEGRCRPDCL